MKILEWNICRGGSRSRALGPAIMAHEPDVVVLCEYREESEYLLQDLRMFGWAHAVASPVTGATNGVAIVSKVPLQPCAAPFGDPPFAWWGVEARVSPDLTVGVYAPLEHTEGASPAIQRQFWEAMHQLVEERRDERVVLIGDFNTGATGIDCPVPVPCADAFEHLSASGWVDAFRARNLDSKEFSFVHHEDGTESRWRIDHAFVSPPLADAVSRCWYSHTERERWASDHSMLLLVLKLR